MKRRAKGLRLYGAVGDEAALAWSWVEQQLAGAGTYWIVASTPGHPHSRPVWGIWYQEQLHLSIGSPSLLQVIRTGSAVTAHLDSGTDVVIVEGFSTPTAPTPAEVIEAYNQKYDWHYQVAQHGHLIRVAPAKVLAWRTAGWAGRDGFDVTGCWEFRDEN